YGVSPVLPIGFIGLGRMGVRMASRLGQAGFRVRAWNRTTRVLPDLPPNTQVVSDVDQAVAGAHTVILMLTDATATEDILFNQRVAERLSAGSVVIDM